MDAEPVFITGSVFSWESLLAVSIIVAAWFVCRRINVMKRPVWQRRLRRLPRGPSGPGMCFPRGAATPDVTIKLKLGDNMFGFCHRKRGGHDCAEARSCGGEGCPISKEMLEAGLISLRRMKEGQKARIAHVQASGELGRRIPGYGAHPRRGSGSGGARPAARSGGPAPARGSRSASGTTKPTTSSSNRWNRRAEASWIRSLP